MEQERQILVAVNVLDGALVKGIQRSLLTHPEIHAHLCLTDPSTRTGICRLRQWLQRPLPDGVIATVTPVWRATLEDLGRPVVNILDQCRTALPTVMVDQGCMGELAAQHLMEQGLRHFAYATPAKEMDYCAQIRGVAFRDFLQAAGFACHHLDVFAQRSKDKVFSDEVLRRWLVQLPKPIGIHAVYFWLAIDIIGACQRLGLRVPADVAVIGGADCEPMTTVRDPAITAFEMDLQQIGFEGMELLGRLMNGGRPPIAPKLIPPIRIVRRQSTDVLGMSDAVVASVRRQIRECSHRPMVVKDLLATAGLSRRALERRFVRVMGHGLHAEVEQAHVERAASLLRDTGLTMSQIAIHSGYADYSTFILAFRRRYAVTPSEFRRSSDELKAAPARRPGKSALNGRSS